MLGTANVESRKRFLDMVRSLKSKTHRTPARELVMHATVSWRWNGHGVAHFSSLGWADRFDMWEDVEQLMEIARPLVANKELDSVSLVFSLSRRVVNDEKKKFKQEIVIQ